MNWRTLSVWVAMGPAVAQASPITRAERALVAFEAGDREAIELANSAADAAVVSRSLGDEPAAWVVRGRVYLARLLHPEIAGTIDPALAAVESFEKAMSLGPDGADHARMSEHVPILGRALESALVNEVEARSWDSAADRLQLALRVRTLDERLRGADPAREAPLRRLAVQVTAELGRASEAQDHYQAFARSSGADDTPLACLVARTMADRGDPAGAIAFIGARSSRYPGDEVLLRAEVELLTSHGRTEDAVVRIERALPVLQDSISGLFLAAGLYQAVGQEERARAMWQQVLALDPGHFDSRLALGRSLTGLAVARREELAARAEELEAKTPSREILGLLDSLPEIWREAEAQLSAALRIAPSSRAAAEALVAFYEARIAGLDPESAERSELLALEADRQKLEAARGTLATSGAE